MYRVCRQFSIFDLTRLWPSVGSLKTKMKLSYIFLSASALINAIHATLNITELLTDTPKCAVSIAYTLF